jgi:hypothetical protein
MRLIVSINGPGKGGVVSSPGGLSSCSNTAVPGGSGCLPAFFDYGTVVTLTEHPKDANNVFSGWGGDCASAGTATTCTLSMTQQRNVQASFQPAVAPTITQNPVSQTAGVGQVVHFTAAATGTPAPTVQWQFSSDGGVKWGVVAGATTTTLAGIAGVTVFLNGNSFRAVFSNVAGTAHTTTATLTVQAAAAPIGGLVVLGIPPVMTAVTYRKRHRYEPRHARRKRSGTR